MFDPFSAPGKPPKMNKLLSIELMQNTCLVACFEGKKKRSKRLSNWTVMSSNDKEIKCKAS